MKRRHFLQILLGGLVITSVSSFAQPYYGSHLCGYPGFKCIKVQRGDTWARLFPNARDREIVKRLNRTNMSMKYRSWIIVPNNLRNISTLDLSPFPLHRDTNGKKLIIVDLAKQAFGAYDSN